MNTANNSDKSSVEQSVEIIKAIRKFLVLENLSPNDATVAAILFYPASTIIRALAMHEESAVMVPIIQRNTTKKLDHQLAEIFDLAHQQL